MAESSTPRRQRKGTVVLATVLMALAAFGSTTQTWLTVTLPQDAVQTPVQQVPGSDAATSVTAFALVALAAALAGSISGRVARWVVAVILTAAGVGIVWTSAGILVDPSAAAVPVIGETIGISSASDAVVALTPMPWVAVAAGVLLIAAAAWMVASGRNWGRSRRYESAAAAPASTRETTAHADEIDSWDSLSKGEDPTR